MMLSYQVYVQRGPLSHFPKEGCNIITILPPPSSDTYCKEGQHSSCWWLLVAGDLRSLHGANKQGFSLFGVVS